MKDFIVFAGSTYYAPPGWRGFYGRFETLQEACEAGRRVEIDTYCGCGWWQVVDLLTDKIVAGEGGSHTGLCGEVSANPDLMIEEEDA